ncbi:hypothetical protein F4780DRAFT_747141 [Xylariomycetidae sp. FL0641]|nr:hypothetical protein F4780DRAFT_747141 [Xylariomycetidae sp. FL0641]
MPPAVKQLRRRGPTKGKAAASQKQSSPDISTFARVSKTGPTPNSKKELAATTPKKQDKLEAITPASRKRKVVVSIEDDSSADEQPRKLPLGPSTPSKSNVEQPAKRGRGRPPKKARPEPTPRKRARSPSVSDSDESTVNAGALFKKLRLESSPSRSSSPLTANTSVVESDADLEDNKRSTKRKNQDGADATLPKEVLALVDLHAAFLKTLTLHYAHNGTHAPADLRALCPDVARAWGKRAVTEAEIRVCVGMLGSDPSSSPHNPFALVDYGTPSRSKVCIELAILAGGPVPIATQKLNDVFRANLRALWGARPANEDNCKNFIAALPQASVKVCASVAKAAPLHAKGQLRLQELKQDMAAKKAAKEAKKPTTTTPPSCSTTTTAATSKDQQQQQQQQPPAPKLSLLDRIRAKSAAASAASSTSLSPAQAARRAALHRVPEVASMLGMLARTSSASSSMGRVAFPMATVVQKLRDSLRVGIAAPEGVAAVRALAADVAPGWVRVVTVAGRENVVVEVDAAVSDAEIRRRVDGLLAQF